MTFQRKRFADITTVLRKIPLATEYKADESTVAACSLTRKTSPLPNFHVVSCPTLGCWSRVPKIVLVDWASGISLTEALKDTIFGNSAIELYIVEMNTREHFRLSVAFNYVLRAWLAFQTS